jgi:hypothetical protein
MGASNYTHAEACSSEGLGDWIRVHVNLFAFLGGAPTFVVCDNLKAAVTNPDRYDPGLNRTYVEMASHYGTAILAARPRRPKDKAKGDPRRRRCHRGEREPGFRARERLVHPGPGEPAGGRRGNTTNIAVAIGSSPNEQYWSERIRTELKTLEKRVAFTWLNGLSFEEMLQRAATLPPNTAIFFVLLSVDAAGVPHEEGKAMARLRAVTDAPIFSYSYSDLFLGQGIVGGPLISISSVSREAAGAAMRILHGEAPGGIDTPPVKPGTPKFDWRELQRWNISESRLPAGSEIYFRSPSPWEQYRWPITGGLAVLLLQAAVISWLVMERRRRHLAEAEANNRRREVVRLNRTLFRSNHATFIACSLLIPEPLAAPTTSANAPYDSSRTFGKSLTRSNPS